jgi:hypothetical protein
MIGTGKDQAITTMYGTIALTTLMYVMHAQLWNPGSGWVGNNDGKGNPSSCSRHRHHLPNLFAGSTVHKRYDYRDA